MSQSDKTPAPNSSLFESRSLSEGHSLRITIPERQLEGMEHRRVKHLPPRLPLEIRKSTVFNSLNTIPSSHSSVWTKYIQKHHIGLNNLISVAQRKEPLQGFVLVRQMKKGRLDRKLRILSQFRRKDFFMKTFEVFITDSVVGIVWNTCISRFYTLWTAPGV
jgi:hypothetical protein